MVQWLRQNLTMRPAVFFVPEIHVADPLFHVLQKGPAFLIGGPVTAPIMNLPFSDTDVPGITYGNMSFVSTNSPGWWSSHTDFVAAHEIGHILLNNVPARFESQFPGGNQHTTTGLMKEGDESTWLWGASSLQDSKDSYLSPEYKYMMRESSILSSGGR
jgi:hypothetical protein